MVQEKMWFRGSLLDTDSNYCIKDKLMYKRGHNIHPYPKGNL